MSAYFDTAAAAERMCVKPSTIRDAIKSGELIAKRTSSNGGRYLMSSDALDAWFDGLADA